MKTLFAKALSMSMRTRRGGGRWLHAACLSVLLCALAEAPAGAAEAVVTDVRVSDGGGKTRLVLDLNKEVTFKVFALADPYRVVIDLPEVGWRLPARPLPTGIGILKKLRYGLFEPGTSRIVLDVTRPPSIENSFVLKPDGRSGYRVVVDMRGVAATAFSKTPKESGKPARAVAAALMTPPKSKPAARAAPQAKKVIYIDPGHGGVDPGTIGASGTYEKHITLAMARELKAALDRTGRFKTMLTRNRDIFIALRQRVERARDGGADLFISIHADSIKNRKTRGLSVYTLSERASDKEAAALAEKENKADLIAGVNFTNHTPEVANILIDLAQRESKNQSVKFASGLVESLRRQTKMLRNPRRSAGFAVLKAPDVPSVLIELGFLSNRKDEKALKNKKYRGKLAKSMVQAISHYFSNVEEASRK